MTAIRCRLCVMTLKAILPRPSFEDGDGGNSGEAIELSGRYSGANGINSAASHLVEEIRVYP